MALQCGIVGLPNVGKSTLFNCLSNAKAQAANFPFCTIEPNVGVITVPDQRLVKLAEIDNPKRVIPTTIEIVATRPGTLWVAGVVRRLAELHGVGRFVWGPDGKEVADELGFEIIETPDQPFHFTVRIPADAAAYAGVVQHIVNHEKPAAMTADLQLTEATR